MPPGQAGYQAGQPRHRGHPCHTRNAGDAGNHSRDTCDTCDTCDTRATCQALKPGERILDSRERAVDLKQYIVSIPDFPQPGILFRDIMPLLKMRFEPTIDALDGLLEPVEWAQVDVIGGIESRGFILGAALALRRGKGFVPIRKQGKLPPPVSSLAYQLEYGAATLEMQPGTGTLVLVDDVVATGGTMLAAAELCARSGYTVAALAALIDLNLVPDLNWSALSLRSALTYD